MNKYFIQKNFLVLIAIIFALLFNSTVFALTIKTPNEIQLDTSIVSEDPNYRPNNNILVGVMRVNKELLLNNEELYKGIHYFTVDRLGFNDIPFHFVITQNGDVFEGNTGGYERDIAIDGFSEPSIIILYVTDDSALTFEPRSLNNLRDLLLKVANENAIEPTTIDLTELSFVRNREDRTVILESSIVIGTWNSDILEVIDEVQALYSPVQKTYAVSIDNVVVPQIPIDPGSTINIDITLSNLQSYGIYSGTLNEAILSKSDGLPSNFYLANNWVSLSDVPFMSNDALLPNETKTFTVEFRAPLEVGSLTEQFIVRTVDGIQLTNDVVEVNVVLNETDQQIIEVQQTETGTLNVRETPSSVGNLLTQVSPGQRFFVLNTDPSGFIEIDLGNGTSGWVASWLVNFIN